MNAGTIKGFLAVLAASALAACSSGQGNNDVNLGGYLLDTVRTTVATRGAQAPQVVVVTPEMLAQTQSAALQVNPEIRGGSDFLRRIAARNDSRLGTVEVWRSSDNAQVFLRNGVVVGTRGIGGDIIAADANMTVRALQNRAQARGQRSYIVSDGDATSVEHIFECTVTNQGSVSISVVNQIFNTSRMIEDCTGGPDGKETIRNTYWVENATGLVRKSRQWVGPRTGYFEFILLKN